MSSSMSLYQLSAILLVVTQSIFCDATDKSKDVYIVYMGSLRRRFGYKPAYSMFATTHYVVVYKIIHMYYLKKLHDSLNKLCD